ncbi:hypothetical protein I2I05_17970 [Hymenobacter sp. BT683]|uniref:Uncharacterized protein n=1 Tax=Hymenobacter jeongseonensis TaxID=2791027 RepID=A0ABS0IMM0_9BACT|nr:hypothetical protein [Hymenobacter jeongseonensis]MBF9239284.1 hypothetical protein [Hymenobacter jeongseonensis]
MNTDNTRTNDHSQMYLAIGKLVVRFEHLTHSLKMKLTVLCGMNYQTRMLVEDYSMSQAIDGLSKQIEWQLAAVGAVPQEVAHFRFLISDLRTLNTNRNNVIHREWELDTPKESNAITSGRGRAFVLKKPPVVYTHLDVDAFSHQADRLHRVIWTIWAVFLDPSADIPPLYELWHRSAQGEWTDDHR